MPTQIFKAAGSLGHRRPVTHRYPPQHGMGFRSTSEPFTSTIHDLDMCRVIHIGSQSLEITPYRHVDYHVVPEGTQGRGIAVIGHESPLKPVRGLGDAIDAVEVGDKIGEQRRFDRCFQVGDIQLSEFKCRHYRSPTATLDCRSSTGSVMGEGDKGIEENYLRPGLVA